jgi:hypothetical protein
MVSLVRNPPAFPSTRHVRIIWSMGTQIFQTAHNTTRHLDRALILLPRLRCTLHHHVLRHRTMVSRRLATNNSPLDRPTICYWPRPAVLFGGLVAPVAAWLLPRVAAQWILAFGSLTMMLSCVLLVTMPAQQSYWAQVFPATILMSVCPDFIFTAAQIIANSVRIHEQGIAGSLILLLQLWCEYWTRICGGS